MWRGLCLLDPVALHNLSLLCETKEPGPARLLLPVHSGWVDHIVVLKNGLLKLALRREHLLRRRENEGWRLCGCSQKVAGARINYILRRRIACTRHLIMALERFLKGWRLGGRGRGVQAYAVQTPTSRCHCIPDARPFEGVRTQHIRNHQTDGF